MAAFLNLKIMSKVYVVTAESVTLGSGTYRKGAEIAERKIKHLAELLESKAITLKTATEAPVAPASTKPTQNGK